MTRQEVAQVLYEVHKLPAVEQMVIKLRYGLLTGTPLTAKQTADHIGLPTKEVRRVERRVLDRIADEYGRHLREATR